MGRIFSQTTDSSVNWGHDVLLDTNLGFLNLIVESSGQHNRNLMGHTLRSVWSLYETDLDVIQI